MENDSAPFYADLADHYDEMTRFESRLVSEKPIVEQWLRKYDIKSAVDVACGTGLHAILLAQLDVDVVGTDLSESMLRQAERNAAVQGVAVQWLAAPMQSVAERISADRDAVFCLGNSIPHLLDKTSLLDTLFGFRKLLRTGGIAMLQLLNYDRILAEKSRVVGVHRVADREFVRFYDFGEDTITFNILTIEWQTERVTHTLSSTTLKPYRWDELRESLESVGFDSIRAYGDLRFNDFDISRSGNLVIVAQR